MEINHLAILIIYLIKKKEEPQKLPDDLIKLIMDINTEEIKEEKEFVNWCKFERKHKILMEEMGDWIIAFDDCFEGEVEEGSTPTYTFHSYTLEGIADGGGRGGFSRWRYSLSKGLFYFIDPEGTRVLAWFS
tara:strand:+ start:51 stop:446 length:396 start_codon:yes stop_codon:yes gene_type:complete